MDAKEFLRELVRMCKSNGEICGDCQIRKSLGCPLIIPENIDTDKLVAVVEKWSKEHPVVTNGTNDLISRQATIKAMWKALYDYQCSMEKQFMENDELNLHDWFQHRIFVQRMHEECLKAVESILLKGADNE